MPDTVSPIEIAYTAVMLSGLLITLTNVMYALERLRELRRRGENGPVLVLRKGVVFDQSLIAGVFVCLMAIGVVSLLTPPRQATPTPAEVISGSIFLVMGVLLLIKTTAVRLRPSQLRHEADKEAP